MKWPTLWRKTSYPHQNPSRTVVSHAGQSASVQFSMSQLRLITICISHYGIVYISSSLAISSDYLLITYWYHSPASTLVLHFFVICGSVHIAVSFWCPPLLGLTTVAYITGSGYLAFLHFSFLYIFIYSSTSFFSCILLCCIFPL